METSFPPVHSSSVLGFGAALTLLEEDREIARLLSEALATVVPADLCAVALYDAPEAAAPNDPADAAPEDLLLVGQHGAEPLSDAAAQELCEVVLAERSAARAAPQAEQTATLDPDAQPTLRAMGVRRCTLVRLGTIDRAFGTILVGGGAGDLPGADALAAVQMLAAQASLSLERIQLEREREAKAEALRESKQALREAHDQLEDRVRERTRRLQEANERLRAEIEERKRQEAMRRKQAAAMDAAMVGIAITNPDGDFVYANPAHADMFGFESPDDLVGRSWRMLYDDAVAEAFETEYLPEVRETGRWWDEVVARTQDGQCFHTEVSLAELGGGIAWVCHDLTRRKASEETIRQYADRLETLRTIDQAILAAESPVEIADAVLHHAQEILPYESASVAEVDWESETVRVLSTSETNTLDSPTALPLDEVYLSENLRAGETEVISDDDYEAVPKAAHRIREMGLRSILCLPMVVEGDVIGVVHVGRTEPNAFTEEDWQVGRELADHMAVAIRQARLVEEVQRHSERLERRVKERTEELESFTYSVSHDLRTPLRAIDGFARMLIEEHASQLDDEGQRKLQIVVENTQKMGQLIDDLLALSRLGRREMRRRPVDMEALAQDVFDDLRRNASDRLVTFTVQPLPPAHADRRMVRRVLENLLSNALKFTRQTDAPEIEVGATEQDGQTVYVVRDNGAGFDADYADKMFGVFQRLHDESEFSGTGVGLAIVERVVQRHGGTVWAEGSVGAGATFYFTLSRSEHDDASSGERAPHRHSLGGRSAA